MLETTLSISLVSPQERKERVNIALGAAKVGQLTKMMEYTVENSHPPTEEDEGATDDGWEQKQGLSQPNLVMSNHFQVIHEAAAMGRMRPSNSLITTMNSRSSTISTMTEDDYQLQQRKEQHQQQQQQQQHGGPIKEAADLVDAFVQSQIHYKQQVLLSPETRLERLDDLNASKEGLSLLSPIVPRLTLSRN